METIRLYNSRHHPGARASLRATEIKPKLFEQLRGTGVPACERDQNLGFAEYEDSGSEKTGIDPEQEFREAGLSPLTPSNPSPRTRQSRDHAQKLIEEAKAESIYLLENARKEAEAAKKKACDEGYQEGFARGSREATEQIKEEGEWLTTLLRNALEEVTALKGKILDDTESEILKLVMMLTEKLVHCELSSHQEAIVGVVKEAVKLVKDKNNIVIEVSPGDHEILKEYGQDFLDLVEATGNLSIDENESIERGGCILETNAEIVDSRLETRLAEAVRAISNCSLLTAH